MTHSMSTRDSRSNGARPFMSNKADTLRGTPPSKSRAEQPIGGARLSKSCGVHDDAGPLPPLRR
jgi:hypothetical protein